MALHLRQALVAAPQAAQTRRPSYRPQHLQRDAPAATAGQASRPCVRIALNAASTRARNRFGDDVVAQILWMRLDGLRLEEIASALGCDAGFVGERIDEMQTSVSHSQPTGWIPRLLNRRRHVGDRFAVADRSFASSAVIRAVPPLARALAAA